MSKTFLEMVGSLSEKMLETMASLPQIQSVDDIINNMSPDMRRRMSFALGPEFQAGMAALTNQELEAVKKLREIHLRMAIYQNRLALAAQMAPENLNLVLEAVSEMQKVAKKWDTGLDKRWEQVSLFIQAQSAQNLVMEVIKGMPSAGPDTVEAIKLLMANVTPKTPPESDAGDEIEGEYVDEAPSPYTPGLGSNGYRRRQPEES